MIMREKEIKKNKNCKHCRIADERERDQFGIFRSKIRLGFQKRILEDIYTEISLLWGKKKKQGFENDDEREGDSIKKKLQTLPNCRSERERLSSVFLSRK